MAMPQQAPPTVGTTDTGDTEYTEPAKELDESAVVDALNQDTRRLVLAATEQDTRSGLPWFATETKRHDPHFRWYREQHGARCWELDALSPVVLRDRVEQAIVERLDRDAWHRADVTERSECESLATILQAWPGVARASSISEPASE